MKKLSVIIINYNTAEMTERAIGNFMEKEKGLDAEIILIDNGSKDPVRNLREICGHSNESLRVVAGASEQRKDVISNGIKLIINKENLGFARAVNQGIEASNGEYILLLNSDVFIKEKAISAMIEYMEKNKEIGVMGPRFLYPDGRSQISAGHTPSFWREIMRLSLLYKISPFNASYVMDFKNVRDVDWLSGGCMLIKRELIKDIGPLDGNYFFGYEDMDFCLRARRAGWRIVYFPLASVVHCHGFSSGGRRAVWRTKMERDGITYFFKKNFPEKRLTQEIIRLVYNFKILVFKILRYK